MNEIVLFRRFRIFCSFDPALLGILTLLRVAIGTFFSSAMKDLESWKVMDPRKEKERGIQRGTPHHSMNHFHKSDRRLEGEKD